MMNTSLRAEKSKRCSDEGVESIRWNPPASDHRRRPVDVRRVPDPGAGQAEAGDHERSKETVSATWWE